jgi:hypothetical protein
MAGSESGAGNPLLADFMLIGRKLEQLGFTCSDGKVIVIEFYEY